MKTFKQALQEAKKVGAAKAQGEAHIAQLAHTLCIGHPGCNPEMIYNGALKLNLSAKALMRMASEDPAGFGDLMFV